MQTKRRRNIGRSSTFGFATGWTGTCRKQNRLSMLRGRPATSSKPITGPSESTRDNSLHRACDRTAHSWQPESAHLKGRVVVAPLASSPMPISLMSLSRYSPITFWRLSICSTTQITISLFHRFLGDPGRFGRLQRRDHARRHFIPARFPATGFTNSIPTQPVPTTGIVVTVPTTGACRNSSTPTFNNH